MNLNLSPETTRFIQAQIASGVFASPEELVDIAVLRMRGEGAPWTNEALREALAKGMAEAERGEFVEETIQDMIGTIESRYPNAKL